MEFDGTPFLYNVMVLLAVTVAVQLFYWLRYYLRAVRSCGINVPESHREPVSVVICARNEAENLRANLPAVLRQNHPRFEVVVVNDNSEDDSDIVLSQLKNEYPHLKISTINIDHRFRHNKKLAQVIGVKAASNEILLMTDADCIPVSDEWLTLMTLPLTRGSEIVLGYGGYSRARGLLNRFIRYESMFIAMQYSGMALRGVPYMGVGRNLAYRKELFLSNNGFSTHYHMDSGDDDLFVNANATATNTSVVLSRNAHTRSVAAGTLREFIRQKKRHLTTAARYNTDDKIRLTIEPLSRMAMYISAIVLLSSMFLWQLVVPLTAVPLIVRLMIVARAGKKFDEPGIVPPALFFDFFSPVINSLLYIGNFSRKPGRKI